MTTPKYSAKLDSLKYTVDLYRVFDARPLAEQIRKSIGRPVVAVGSGGSHVVAYYLDRTLETLGSSRVQVQTPMDLVVSTDDLRNTVVWLFSASANNADISAAAKAARDRGCANIVLCTCNEEGNVSEWVRNNQGEVLVVPVADKKDGYLATHSLISTCTAIFLAASVLSDGNEPQVGLVSQLEAHLLQCQDTKKRSELAASFARIPVASTVILIADPSLRPVSCLLETSMWETALSSVQVTDMRNFAHGRHAWLHHHTKDTFILALTGQHSQASWSRIEVAIGSAQSPLTFSYRDCGRKQNLFGIIDGLFWLEAMGLAKSVDPAKPGIADFGRSIYEDTSLSELANELPAPVRQKLGAAAQSETVFYTTNDVRKAFATKLETLRTGEIGALVLDYDGTVVSTDQRFQPPRRDIIGELIRLQCLGVAIAFASGRGGSLGQELRSVFPDEVLSKIVVGYFNGGHIISADKDLDIQRPKQDPVIIDVAQWLANDPSLMRTKNLDPKEIQLSIAHKDINNPAAFLQDLERCPAIAQDSARVVASGHSFDVIPITSNKLNVVHALQKKVGDRKAVFSLGDSGTTIGNDYDLLARDFGLSVDRVCPDLQGCWSLYGARHTGPDALLKILRAVISSPAGGIRLDVTSLGLDFFT